MTQLNLFNHKIGDDYTGQSRINSHRSVYQSEDLEGGKATKRPAVQLRPTPPKKTSKIILIEVLEQAQHPLAVHELNIFGYSENNLATRLSELAKDGKIIGKYRKGCSFKEWSLIR